MLYYLSESIINVKVLEGGIVEMDLPIAYLIGYLFVDSTFSSVVIVEFIRNYSRHKNNCHWNNKKHLVCVITISLMLTAVSTCSTLFSKGMFGSVFFWDFMF